LYHILVGEPPFQAGSAYLTFGRIAQGTYDVPDFVSEDAADLIAKLLVRDPHGRIGYGEMKSGYISIQQHPFFKGIDWNRVSSQPIVDFESCEAACQRRSLALKSLEEIENQRRLKSERTIQASDAVLIDAGVTIEGMLVLTDTPRLLLRAGEKIVREFALAEDLSMDLSGDVLHLKNGNRSFMVKTDEAGKWKETLERICNDM
jgi:serine/threonine protein kinase